MRDFVEPRMEQRYGPRWQETIARQMHTPFNRQDILSYKNALVRSGAQRQLIQGCFPVPFERWQGLLRAAADWRHALVGHADDVSLEQGFEGTTTLLELSRVAAFGCDDELEYVLDRFVRLQNGEPAYPAHEDGKALGAREQDTQSGAAMRALQVAVQESSNARQLAEEAANKTDRVVEELEAARREIEQLRTDQEATRKTREEQARALEVDLALARQELAQREEELASAEAARRAAEESAEPVIDVDPEMLQQLVLEAVRSSLQPEPQPGKRRTPKAIPPGRRVRIGQKWPFPRGATEWYLDARRGWLTRIEDDVRLDQLIQPRLAQSLVGSFLEIRPEGGRVWLDADGDACTYKRKRYVYLGRIEELADGVPAPIRGQPSMSSTATRSPAAKNTVLPDPGDVPRGTVMVGIKAADGLHRRPHQWVSKRSRSGKAFWTHSPACLH